MSMPLAEALRLVRDDISTTLEPETLRQLGRDCGHRWRERLLGPVTTIHRFVLQILHGHTACAHRPHLAGMAFTDSAYCQAGPGSPWPSSGCGFGVSSRRVGL